MNVEEILMRVGVDAQGVVSGMSRVTSLVKAQATLLVEDLKGMAGRWIGVFGAERAFESIKERVLSIKRAAEQTGLSTNMVQGIFNKIGEEGEDYEKVIKPLTQLTGLTKNSKQFLGDLADAYVKLNTQEERNAMLMNAGIKNWQALIPILKDGRDGIEELDKGNFFTKLSPKTINTFSEFWKGFKIEGMVALNTIGNALGTIFSIIPRTARAAGVNTGGAPRTKEVEQYIKTGEWPEDARKKSMEAENKIGEDGFSLADKRAQIEAEITKQIEERAHLQQSINDRDKFGLDELAERARKLTGLDKMPRGLNSVYTITPAMASALQVQTLEDQAKIAQAYGNGSQADRLQSTADRLRASNPALKSTERYPIQKTQEQIARLDANIKFIHDKLAKVPTPP